MPVHSIARLVSVMQWLYMCWCGYMGKEGVKVVNRLGDIAADSGHIPKCAFVRWAVQRMQRCTAAVGWSSRGSKRYDAGFAVPVLMS